MGEDVWDTIPHMDDDLWSALSDLREEIDRAEVVASKREPRDGLYLHDRTVIGFLDGARKHAEVYYVAALHGAVEDLAHPRRFVFESFVDLLYLLTEPDPHRAAARIAVWECRRADWVLRFVERQSDELSEPPIPSVRSGSPFGERRVKRLAELLDDPAEAELVLDAFEESRGGRPAYHWSGKGRFGERLRSLEGRLQQIDSDSAALLRQVLEFDWQVASADTHPRAGWAEVVSSAVEVEPEPYSTEDQVRLIEGGLEMLLKRAVLMLTTRPPGPEEE